MGVRKWLTVLFIVTAVAFSCTASGYAEATKDAYVCHMHTDDYADADNFVDMLDDKLYSTATYYGSACLPSKFDDCDRTVMYWSAHGDSTGQMWGSNGPFDALSQINISGTDSDWENPTHTITRSDWDGDLEFVFISACNQLHSDIRYKYARGMLGTNRVRVISGYHDYAPGPPCDGYITQTFETYADASESVKSSWIQANEYWAARGYSNPNNWCVLTHAGSVQYSRMPGFGGVQYDRPGTATASILRFSQLYPNGTPQPLELTAGGLLLSCEPQTQVSIPTYSVHPSAMDISAAGSNGDARSIEVIREDADECLYAVRELGDGPVTLGREAAVELARNWASAVFGDRASVFTANLSDVIPLVVAEVNLEGQTKEETESTFAYSVRFANNYEGVRVRGNFCLTLVDDNGVAASALRWQAFTKSGAELKGEPLSYDAAIELLSAARAGDTDPNSRTLRNAELVYSTEVVEDGSYRPTWEFDMADGSIVLIDCFTSECRVIR